MMYDAISSLFTDKGKSEDKAEAMFKRYSIDTAKKYGEGGYGATFPAIDNETKEAMAVKVIDTRRMKLESILKECTMLECLNHPNVIKVKDHGLGRKATGQDHLYYIFMELASGGELFDQVIDRGANAMPEDVARGFVLQLVAGVMHCHEHGIAHRDLKLENVLLTKDGVVKVIDFGLSYRYPIRPDGTIDRSVPLKDVCGSKSYAAPEVLAGQGYDGFAADVWSIGVSLFAMLSGFFPLDEASAKDWRYTKLRQAQAQRRSTTFTVYGWYKRTCTHLSKSVVELLDAMLTIDPARRVSLTQVLDHPWLCPKQHEAERLQLPLRFHPAPPPAATTTPVVADDQGTYNAHSLVDMDGEGPVWRTGLGVTGPAVAAYMDDEEDEPIYRSLTQDFVEDAPMPTLQRQAAFSRRTLV